MVPGAIEIIDPFDLPDWIGAAEVVWRAEGGVGSGFCVRGRLVDDAGSEIECDLLAVDEAHPAPVSGDDVRSLVHQAWRHGQVVIARHDGRLTLAVPGTGFDADRVLETLHRLVKAVGGSPERLAALIRVG